MCGILRILNTVPSVGPSVADPIPKHPGMTMKTALLLLLLSACSAHARNNSVAINSPDGKLVFTLSVVDRGTTAGLLSYGLKSEGKEIVQPSHLGVTTGDLPDWTAGFALAGYERHSVDTTWAPVYGERSRVRDNHTACTLTFMRNNDSTAVMYLDVRVYNEGAAFRYRFPEHLSTSILHITGELTSFSFAEGTMAYVTPFAQELYHKVPLKDWSYDVLPLPRWSPRTPDYESERPLTLVLPGGAYAAIGEAGLVDHARMKFMLSPDEPNTIITRLFGPVTVSSPYATPWRLIMVASSPGLLLEHNDIFLNLNEPCAIPETGWIKPGKVMREVTLSTAGAEACVDFCAQHGIRYIEFDAGWYGYEYAKGSDASRVDVDPRRNPAKDLDLQRVIAYAKKRNVGVFLYINHRALEQQIDEVLPVYERWGVAGLKFGFVHVGSDRWTHWLHEAVKKAARHHLMVDIHDEYRPTGVSRTYPNLLTQEGVYGNECMPDANHNTTLPFTRFLAGAADYTICYYHQSAIRNVAGIKTTSAHQMALAVIFYSPLQFVFWYDKPSDYQGEPEVEFFDHLPTIWDTTVVLAGEIGHKAAIARRHGDGWFVGAITNNDGRTIDLPLRFLSPGLRYVASTYEDGGDTVRTRTHVKIGRAIVDASTIVRADLKPSGGIAIEIRPATREDLDRYPRYEIPGQ